MTAPTKSRAGRRVWPWVALFVALGIVAALAGAPNQQGSDYDPKSSGESGTKALVELVSSYDVKVDITDVQPPRDADLAIMFPGEVPVDRQQALRDWVAQGHTLVVADPRSDLNPSSESRNRFTDTIATSTLNQGDCNIAALRDARTLHLGEELDPSSIARVSPVPRGAQQCFTEVPGDRGVNMVGQAVVVAVPEGKGTIVSVGAPQVFVNGLLDESDNAVLAVDLLAARPGQRLAFLQRPPGSKVDLKPEDLLSDGVKQGFVQLALAFLVLLFVVGRRLGKPVLEPQPVQIAGSELVSAVGNLLQQTKSPDRAATVLRADVRRRLSERLGLPADAAPDVIAASVEARAGIDQALSLPLLADGPCPTETALLDLAAGLDDLRRHVLGGA